MKGLAERARTRLLADGPDQRAARRLATLATVGLVDAALVGLRQIGAVRHLPDGSLPGFATDRITTSTDAYALGMADAPLAALGYAAELFLAAVWPVTPDPLRRPAWRLLEGIAVMHALGALGYLGSMMFRQRRACPWCLVAIGIDFALVRTVRRARA